MRKVLKYFCGAVMVTLLLLAPAIIGGAIETHYFLKAMVSAVLPDRVVVVDENGETWSFKGDNFAVDDKVKLLMHTNCTDFNFEDDKIVKVFRA